MNHSENQPDPSTSHSFPFWKRHKLPFTAKISAHITIMILLTGIAVTAVLSFQYRRQMYQHEDNTAFTAYTTVAHEITDHYIKHGNQFDVPNLDYRLRSKSLRLGSREEMSKLLPSYLVLYGLNGKIIYEYTNKETHKQAEDISLGSISPQYQRVYDRRQNVLQVFGPVNLGEEILAYVHIDFPTTVVQELAALYKQSFLVMVAVIVVAMFLSFLFARSLLAPISALTRAAKKVYRGDMDQQVPVSSDDEIGELTTTFNTMVSTLSTRIRNIHAMQESTVRISRELDQTRLFQLLADLFSAMAGSAVFRLGLHQAKTGEFITGAERSPERLPPPDRDPLAQRAFAERWVVFKKPAGTLDTDPKEVNELAIPLLSGTHRIGVIRLGPRKDYSFYDEETITLLETLAQHASVSIDNARLYEQLGEKERIEQEMTLAREIQQAMLPREVPSLPGYDVCGGSIPAYEVGGDYFDYVLTKDNHWHFVIADVSGKGVPAALIMSIVRSLVHTYAEFESSPRTILNKTNRNLSGDIKPEMFVTIASLDLDPVAHKIRVARAGHEPVIVRRAGGAIEEMKPPGAALGMLESARFDHLLEEAEYSIGHHETLLLYTDGVTEAQNSDKEEFGIERLEEVLREHGQLHARELYRKIIESVKAFVGRASQRDDITLLIVQRNGTV